MIDLEVRQQVWLCWPRNVMQEAERPGCIDGAAGRRRGHERCGWYTIKQVGEHHESS